MISAFLLSLFLPIVSAQENVQDVFEALSATYSADGLERAAIDGMIKTLDDEVGLRGSKALTTQEYRDWQAWKRGERDGFGLRIQVLAGRGFVIEEVMAGSPAGEVGLQAGDFIVSVNTRRLNGLSAPEMLSILEAEGQDRLIVDVIRQGEKQVFKLYKGSFAVPQVTLSGKNTLRIQFFGEDSSQQIQEMLSQQSNLSILDLRDNQGGLWEEAIETLDLFCPQETILAYRAHHDGTQIPVLSQKTATMTKPMVILINQGTKGPAELVALTLQEQGLATLVGERSGGDGMDYHTLYPNPNWVLLMADTTILSSKRKDWQSVGVVPNLSISSSQTYRGEDRQWQTAIQLVSSP